MGALLTRLMLRGSLAQIRHVSPVPPGAAPDLVARVYAQMARDFGMLAPPVALHSPAPECLAACWLMLRESLLTSGAAGRTAKEAVAVRVSAANSCPYCVDVHRATLRGLAGKREAAPEPAAAPDREAATESAAELAGVALTFHYLNRMVNVFLGDSPLPPRLPARARPGLMRLFGLVMRPAARRETPPGESLGLLPEAPLPGDLSWAGRTANLAGAFARAATAIEAAGRRAVPDPVRELVVERLGGWDGAPPGLGRAWAVEAAAGLAPAHRPAGRLALLTAMASYQVDRQAIEEFRRAVPDDVAPGDRELVELTAWSSLAAARRFASADSFTPRTIS
ncbi:carboxymuconolactone decarboxylase family protein [Sphaerimonospora thailandensis]|uniref:Alkyl hydroperoxide reductase AhpD n=1 Tax=Sphaerimonospora thailandensis TaxID=795644 RepID=A0A8J3R873_9ACTN|nr:carboxymuconolactone decarboxylase family protein [Sphaerimonospora thailandensis]GIH67813.1 alkyl hydroperoxide reductase AhpD [Sphaerimonospora thailandensis]